MDNADSFLKIPMFGFTESYNLSVSVGICLHTVIEKMRKSSIAWQLSDNERIDIMLDWMRNTLKHPEFIESKFE